MDLDYMAMQHMTKLLDDRTPPLGRIPLRAMALVWPSDPQHGARARSIQGIALPDGRFIFGGNQTYSSERVMLKLNPGAVVEWHPNADEAINYVMPIEDEPA